MAKPFDPTRDPRQRARNNVSYLIKSGRVIKGMCCFGNECRGQVEAHHTDYAQPRVFYWVCKRHHRDLTWGNLTLPHGVTPVEIAQDCRRSPLISPHTGTYPYESAKQARLRKYYLAKEMR